MRNIKHEINEITKSLSAPQPKFAEVYEHRVNVRILTLVKLLIPGSVYSKKTLNFYATNYENCQYLNVCPMYSFMLQNVYRYTHKHWQKRKKYRKILSNYHQQWICICFVTSAHQTWSLFPFFLYVNPNPTQHLFTKATLKPFSRLFIQIFGTISSIHTYIIVCAIIWPEIAVLQFE
jgi:hypothetical protein